MTLRSNTAEGTASGTTVTAANSASGGNAFDLVSVTGTPTANEFSTAQAMHGSSSYHHTSAASSYVFYRYAGASAASIAARMYIRWVALPTSAAGEYLHVRDTAGVIIASISTNTTQKLAVRGKSATLQDNWFTPSLNVWYRLELRATKGTSSTDGTVAAAVYAGDDTTAAATYSSSTVDVGTTNCGTVGFGKAAGAGAAEYYLDDLASDDGRTTFIGAPATNVKPTASAGSTQYVARNSTVTLSGTDADSDGTVVSRQWTCTEFPAGATAPTITNATSATASAPVTVAGIYRFTYVVTDNGGLTSTPSEVAIAVYPLTGEDVQVYSQFLTLNAWTKYGSAATTVAGLNDADATTGILSPTNPTSGQNVFMYLNPIGPGDVKLYLSGRWIDAAVTRTVTLCKPDGSTVVKTWTVAPTNSDAEVELVVDAAGLALIPNLADRALMLLKIAAAVA